MFTLALVHAFLAAKENRIQRFLMLLILFIYGFLLEYMGVSSGNYNYAEEAIMIFGIIPLSVTFAWVGIIYSIMLIGELLELPSWLRIITTSLIALSIDWGMDPIAVHLGAWTWTFEGQYYKIPGFNFIGWFFIPIAYLIPYGIIWNKENKKPELLTIKQVETHRSWTRKLYTLLVVVPIASGILLIVGVVSRVPFLFDMHLIALVIWAMTSVILSVGIIVWKHENLKRKVWYDLLPSIILIILGINYTLYGFFVGRMDLGFLMVITGLPIWLIFIFTLVKKE